MQYLLIYLCVINLVAFILCYIDKVNALKHKRRIPEKYLIFTNILGGCFLFLVGMHLFHHKTKKKKFKMLIPIFIIIWVLLILSFN